MRRFFTTEAAFTATLNRFRFVIERWGGSGVIGAWDLFNEIHPFWGGTPREQSASIARLSDAIRDIELKTWGFTRPQTVSIFGPNPGDDYAKLIWAHPCLDFASTHIYEEGAIDYPLDPVTPALAMQKWVTFARREIARDNNGRMRPYLDSEHGPIHLFNDHRKFLSEANDDWYERHLMWAHLASGGAGSGMRWPARHPHVITPGMKSALKSLRDFSRFVDWRTFSPRVDTGDDANVDLSVQTEHGAVPVHLFTCRDETQMIAWILQRDAGKRLGFAPAVGTAFGVYALRAERSSAKPVAGYSLGYVARCVRVRHKHSGGRGRRFNLCYTRPFLA